MRTLCFDQPFVNKNLDENNSMTTVVTLNTVAD